MIFLKAFLRQIKFRLLFLLNCLKRLLCFGRQKSPDTGSDVEIITSDFVVVENNCNKTNFNDSNYPYASNSVSNKKETSNYSSYSLLSIQQQQAQQHYSVGKFNVYNEQNNNNFVNKTSQEEPEPDYFKDMVPELKKPKTVYINKTSNETTQDLSRKFRVSDKKMVDLDEKKFTPFGTLEDEHGNNSAALNESTWEDMAAEEESWNDIEKSLDELRKEKRERRLREHQQQRMMKSAVSNSSKKTLSQMR